MMTRDEVTALGRGRWTAPLLARIGARGGARFAELLAALDLPRDSLVRALGFAIDQGWVARAEGHGHPLRPEYLLTPAGEAMAARAGRLIMTSARLGLEPRDLPRWSLPVLWRLEPEARRFSTLRADLTPVTPRALSLTLKQMIETRLVDRRLEDAYPPSALYGLAPAGLTLAAALTAD
jgi:DNA-binding HxlR family transcriptional regulator